MGMKPIEVRPVTTEELNQLDELYRRAKDVRVCSRVQMILLGAEEKMTAPQIAQIVRQDEQTVRRWIKRFNAEGVSGLFDEQKSGARNESLMPIGSAFWLWCAGGQVLWINPTHCGPCNGWLISWPKKQVFAFPQKPYT